MIFNVNILNGIDSCCILWVKNVSYNEFTFFKKNPFSFIEISSDQKILEKCNFHSSGLQTIFATYNSIKSLQNFDQLNNVDSNTDQVVIIDSCNQFNYEEGPTNIL